MLLQASSFQPTADHVIAARRHLARQSLADFACLIDIPTAPLTDSEEEDRFSVIRLDSLVRHHALICAELQAVAEGRTPNLMLLLPPGSAKSTYADVVFVPWFMAKYPRRNVILASYATNITRKQGRRARQLVKSKSYGNLFPGLGLSAESSAADEWALSNGSEFMGGGLLSGLTGNRAALGILDDPIAGREEAESPTIRQKTWDAYLDDFCSRLIPGAPQIMILCMTGDTPVLMESGAEKPLRDIRPGDRVATREGGALSSSTVRNWANQGPDQVYEIRTKSGITVRANARHPFLVVDGGKTKWVRTDSLKPGSLILRVTGGSGAASRARNPDVKAKPLPEACAESTMVELGGTKDIAPRQPRAGQGRISSFVTGTESALTSTRRCSRSKRAAAQFAGGPPQKALQITGAKSSASITATTPALSGDCCATTAISLLDEAETQTYCAARSNTFSSDEVVSVTDGGIEDVFDIQVDRTENFIANGLVSHNTRWHQDDPAGRILPEEWNGESGVFEGRDGRTWKVLCIPAQAERPSDPLGRAIGEYLWPEWFSEAHFAPFKRNLRTWTSLYQQRPAPEEGSYFKAEWFKRYALGDLPKNLRVFGTSDYAVTESGGDFTVLRLWGIDAEGHMWLLPFGWRGQTTADKWVEEQITLMTDHRPFAWFGEGGVIQKTIEPLLLRRMRERQTYCRLEWLPSIADKPTRARGAQGRAAMGMIHIPEGPEGDMILDEFVRFPGGRYDDDVDNLSLMGRALDMAHPAIVPAAEEAKGPPRGINELTWDELMAMQTPQRERV